ncbi:hypothetical protein DVH05_007749 [Phytophthora capsici]|nr:hypothetical protein DVH05_007749 [Phytophthora capsici]
MVVKRKDGGWATLDDVDSLPGRELRYTQMIRVILPEIGEEEDIVYLRVEACKKIEKHVANLTATEASQTVN